MVNMKNTIFTWPAWVGKTHEAKQILKEYFKKHSTWEYSDDFLIYTITDWRFKQFIKSNMVVLRKPEEWQSSVANYPLEMMIRCKLLLYDDIWVSDNSEAYLRDLTFILDERINKWLDTIFTTNLWKKELEEKLNKRIVSRMLMNATVVTMQGKDRRIKGLEVISYNDYINNKNKL